MRYSSSRVAALAIFVCLCGYAQNSKVDSQNQHERVIALVPFVGSGTMEDPKRPMFAPKPGEVSPGSTTGIVAFHFEPIADRRWFLSWYAVICPVSGSRQSRHSRARSPAAGAFTTTSTAISKSITEGSHRFPAASQCLVRLDEPRCDSWWSKPAR